MSRGALRAGRERSEAGPSSSSKDEAGAGAAGAPRDAQPQWPQREPPVGSSGGSPYPRTGQPRGWRVLPFPELPNPSAPSLDDALGMDELKCRGFERKPILLRLSCQDSKTLVTVVPPWACLLTRYFEIFATTRERERYHLWGQSPRWRECPTNSQVV